MMAEPLGEPEVGANISLQLHREHSSLKSIIKNYREKHKNSFCTYVDFRQVRQGRLVHVRTVVAATCIKI